MKKRVVVSDLAKADLAAISLCTGQAWGEQQRLVYLDDLRTCVTVLGLMPGLGRPRDDLRVGWRTIPSGSHVILYKEHPNSVEILRVLHGRQDVNSTEVDD